MKNVGQYRKAHLRQYKGMTEAEYKALLKAQDGHCALCPATRGSEQYTNLLVDHCHKTGKIRGLVCHTCNTRLIQTVENYSETQVYLAREYIKSDRACVVEKLRKFRN